MPYAQVPGAELWYEDSGGTGVPLVLMHAASGNTEVWAPQLPAFTGAGYRVIRYDRRGWGKSKATGSGQAGAPSDDLHAVAEQVGLDRFHLAGSAAGAGPSLDYALTHPDRLRSLVLADCGAGASAEPAYDEMRKNYRPPQIDALPVECRELSAGYRATDPEGVKRWLEIDHHSRHAENARGGEGAPARHRVTFETLKGLKVPVLMICGQADLVTPPALMRLSAPHIPDCQFELVQEAGHGSHWEKPEIWNKLVLDFIKAH